MSKIFENLNTKAIQMGIPLGVHLDVTWRCNERCVHCYLDHDDLGELSYDEIEDLMNQMAEAGVFFLTISGGEPLLRKDLFAIIRRARELTFNVKLKTNGILIREKEAALIRELGVETVQVSIYSHRAEVHDAITKVKGSLERSIDAIRFMVSQGLKVTVANVVMKQTRWDYPGVQALAAELGAYFTVDPTITPHINGDRSLLRLNVDRDTLREIMNDKTIAGEEDEFIAVAPGADEDVMDNIPCSAGHSACYVSPYGDVYPCVQFPLPSGNVRQQKFIDIWKYSPQLEEVRSIRTRDLPVCSTCSHAAGCSRCPGLAYMEGNMRGPSTADCEKSYARTGVPSANMLIRQRTGSEG
ncbi:radical SAM/SPASM domain-containing protein [Candidatus Binatus sp.]|uniref:radical SAM protein n=1 Tax=Candidatus Binatus sp. TaxID=2811406 RepID=UPI003C8CE896